jgi:alpha-amylase
MVDVVANHIGVIGDDFNRVSYPLNFRHNYHNPCPIDYSNQWSVENCRIGSLWDINTEKEENVDYLYKWINWLVQEFEFDGIRVDTVKHVRSNFWLDYARHSGVFALGEVFHGDPAYVGPYQSVLPSLFNYPMYYTINDVFLSKKDMRQIGWRLSECRQHFRDTSVLGVFLDNHDNPRFLSLTKGRLFTSYQTRHIN